MAEDTISKPRAKRIRLLSQIASLVCVAGAVLAVVVGVPLLLGDAPPRIAFADVESDANRMYQDILARRADQGSDGAEALPPDLTMIAETLALVSNKPTPKSTPTPEKEEGNEDTTDTPAPVAASSKTRFVGTVGIGNRLMALVTAGGAQKIMGEGDEATLPLADGDSGDPPRVSIRSVTPDEVVLVENGTERTVERAERIGVAVSTSVANVAPAGASGADEAAATAGAMSADQIKPVNPDDFRRDDGTIDYEALREAARERARQRQELRRQRREETGDS